jgi:hypothetical protein
MDFFDGCTRILDGVVEIGGGERDRIVYTVLAQKPGYPARCTM